MSKKRQIRRGQVRLERWQAWQLCGGWRACPYYLERVDFATLIGDGIKATDAEAIVTDKFVTQLPKHINRTVRSFYLSREGCSPDQAAAKLRIHRSTFDSHLDTAYTLIEGMWDAHLAKEEKRAAA